MPKLIKCNWILWGWNQISSDWCDWWRQPLSHHAMCSCGSVHCFTSIWAEPDRRPFGSCLFVSCQSNLWANRQSWHARVTTESAGVLTDWRLHGGKHGPLPLPTLFLERLHGLSTTHFTGFSSTAQPLPGWCSVSLGLTFGHLRAWLNENQWDSRQGRFRTNFDYAFWVTHFGSLIPTLGVYFTGT